jgi:GNAT superfamily N-acetyltransferase
MTPHVTTLADRPDLELAVEPLVAAGWPRFALESPLDRAYWERLLREFADYQALLVGEDGRLLGVGQSVPFRWDGRAEGLPEGWDDVFLQAMADADTGRPATAAAALGVTMAAEARGRGLSRLLVRALRDAAAGHGLADLVVPVRPNRKADYPLTPMERYLQWTMPDGRPFDPWLRVHLGLGGEVLGICSESMVVTGTVAEWEEWTGMRFPDSGRYVVPGALVPVEIDRERNQGRYAEPNVWVRHRTSPGDPGDHAAG